MTPVYQQNTSGTNGDCMQSVFASLFNLKLDDVPKFIEMDDDWNNEIIKFCKSHGYENKGTLYNRNYIDICNPKFDCFQTEKRYHEESILTPERLSEYNGIDGFFYASVFSPKYFTWERWLQTQHAVVVDCDVNVVHDPSPMYKELVRYPLTNILGLNGVLEVEIYEKIK